MSSIGNGTMFPHRNPTKITKRSWTQAEDAQLMHLVVEYGAVNWTLIAERLVNRSGKQCRERYHNHLQPDIKKGDWSEEEDRILADLHAKLGNQWAKITKHLPGRTDNAVKNRWHTVHNQSDNSCRSGSSTARSNGARGMMHIPMLALQSTLRGLDLSGDMQAMSYSHKEHGHEITLSSRSGISTEEDNVPLSSRLSQSIFDDPSILATSRMTPRSARSDAFLNSTRGLVHGQTPRSATGQTPRSATGQTPRSARSPQRSTSIGALNETEAQGLGQNGQYSGAEKAKSSSLMVPSLKKAFQVFNRSSPSKSVPRIFSARGRSSSDGPETHDTAPISARDFDNFQNLWEETPRATYETDICLAAMEEVSLTNTARSANWGNITARSANEIDFQKALPGQYDAPTAENSLDSVGEDEVPAAPRSAPEMHKNLYAANTQTQAHAPNNFRTNTTIPKVKKSIAGISPRDTPRDSLLPSLDIKKKRFT